VYVLKHGPIAIKSSHFNANNDKKKNSKWYTGFLDTNLVETLKLGIVAQGVENSSVSLPQELEPGSDNLTIKDALSALLLLLTVRSCESNVGRKGQK
jgi:hypothetical protein